MAGERQIQTARITWQNRLQRTCGLADHDSGVRAVRVSAAELAFVMERKASEGGNANALPCVRQRTLLWLVYIWAGRGPRFSKVPGNLRTIFGLPAHRA